MQDLWKRAKELKAQLTFAIGVLGAFVSIFTWMHAQLAWLDDKIEAIDRSAVDIATMKDTLNTLSEAQNATSAGIEHSLREVRDEAAEEFEARDRRDDAQDARMTALRVEMRARHGEIPLADVSPSRAAQVQQAQTQAAAADAEAAAAVPSTHPLSRTQL